MKHLPFLKGWIPKPTSRNPDKQHINHSLEKARIHIMVKASESQIDNLVALLDGYAQEGGHHLNVNVFSKETLLDAHRRSRMRSFQEPSTVPFKSCLQTALDAA